MSAKSNPRVGLFVTCLVDAIRPGIGFAAIQLLEEAGCRVEVPQAQTCCGQPALNSGDDKDAADLARRTIAASDSALSRRPVAFISPWQRAARPGRINNFSQRASPCPNLL